LCHFPQPANASALVLMSLVEQATAKKDRVKRAQCHVRSYEYCLMANALEPGNPQTLNMLANHLFHTWRTLEFSLGGCFVVDRSHLMLPAQAVGDLIAPKNLLRLRAPDGSASVFTIIAIAAMPSEDAAAGAEEYVTVEVSPRIRPRFLLASGSPAPCAALDIKDLGSVERFAHQAMVRATLPAVLAESSYILGKVAHSLRDANLAFDFYWKALKDAPDMTLAAFGAAEILFSRKEFQASLELFEKVLMKSPEDKDTQAYVMYLKAIIRKELALFDKLREIAPGFQHEADLWLLQGQLRQHDPEQHKHALRCFLNAKECMEQKMGADGDGKTAVSPAILSNIAVLHHSLGQLQKALEFSQLALLAVHAQSEGLASAHQHTPTVFRSAELEGVFYNWSAEAVCQVRVGAEAGHFVLAEGDAADLTALVAAGDEVVLSGVKHIVVRVVSPSEMFCSCPVKAWATAEAATLGLRVKQPLNNFHDGSLTYSFNFARLLEDDGHTKAASEVYFELLKKHPSYMECKRPLLCLISTCCIMLTTRGTIVRLHRLPALEHNILRPGPLRRGRGVVVARAGCAGQRGGGDPLPGRPVLAQRQPRGSQEVLRQDLQRGESQSGAIPPRAEPLPGLTVLAVNWHNFFFCGAASSLRTVETRRRCSRWETSTSPTTAARRRTRS
jgi:tetratricopeptide (TPR) repeat protein